MLATSLISQIRNSPQKSSTKLIAIDGRGGSGKSSLAAKLLELDPSFQIIHIDSFPATKEENPFHPLGTQTRISTSRILSSALIPLSRGQEARYTPTPWWIEQPRIEEEIIITPNKTVLVEGCYSLLPEFRDFYDLKIWLECSTTTARERALNRDGGEKDRQVWEEVYIPNEESYIKIHKPQRVAEVIININEWLIKNA